jgi:hypothetical protein
LTVASAWNDAHHAPVIVVSIITIDLHPPVRTILGFVRHRHVLADTMV